MVGTNGFAFFFGGGFDETGNDDSVVTGGTVLGTKSGAKVERVVCGIVGVLCKKETEEETVVGAGIVAEEVMGGDEEGPDNEVFAGMNVKFDCRFGKEDWEYIGVGWLVENAMEEDEV